MRIARLPANEPVPDDLPGALRARAGSLGHRPAVTVLGTGRREEQGFASLAQWAAKGAHLLQLDLLLEPGDRLALHGPPGWLPAAVAHAAWWAGLTVTDGPAAVAVAHVDHLDHVAAEEVLVWGDLVDGTPEEDHGHEPWAVAVQAFPDQPPPARATTDGIAVDLGGESRSHADVVASHRDAEGTLGIEALAVGGLADWLEAVAARPAVTGRPTLLLLDGLARDAAAGERVGRWLGDADGAG